MSVIFESGYSLPGGDKALNFARIAHAGNWRTEGTVTASSTATGFSADAPKNSLTYEKWQPATLTATWDIDFGSAAESDYCCIAAHDMGTNGNTLTVQYDSTGGGSWVTVATEAIADDSPIMCIFEPETRQIWRVQVSGGTAPSIGVIKFGKALQMERPFYAGFAPARMQRNTTIVGSMSEGGEFLGRTKIRSSLGVKYEWNNLSYAWVRSNLDGPTGLIQSLEAEPFFCAWRASVTDDVDFGWTMGPVQAPTLSGIRDLMNFGFNAEVYAYE